MSRLGDYELEHYIKEDIPYFDLTTHLLDPQPSNAALSIFARKRIVASCVDEAARIGELLGCNVVFRANNSEWLERDALLTLHSDVQVLHRAWRAVQIMLEYACGIATYAKEMQERVKAVNNACEIFTTRKSFPFAKRFSILALSDGGVLPHRLGLSETILIFDHHRSMYPKKEDFAKAFRLLKARAVEKKVVVESDSYEDALEMLALGADVIQMDKCDFKTLAELVSYKQEHYPYACILAAGGINKENAAEYAATGVDGIVTSKPYQAGMADLGAKWERLDQ